MPRKKDNESNESEHSEDLKTRSKITRRKVLKLGAAAGAVTILSPTILTSKKSTVYAQGTVTEPVLCGAVANPSPPHTPFVDNLPVPSIAIPQILNPAPTMNANTLNGEAARDPHQRWNEFNPSITYQLTAQAGTHKFHNDYLPSYIWGFNGQYPGPTILNAYGVPSLVRFKNNLPATTSSFGTHHTTVHLHNGHTGSESDGFAGDFFGPNLFKDNHYANAYAGIDAFGPSAPLGVKGDPREAMRTWWYHDHLQAETANNNYLGMNGVYLVYDHKDPPWEFGTPGSNRLPSLYGVTDFPLLLAQKRFCPTNPTTGRTEQFQVIGSAAPSTDKFTVNGKIQPKLAVRRRKYRFRLINSGVVLPFDVTLHGPTGAQKPMTIVAIDGNFLRVPADISATSNPNHLEVHVSSRADVIIDFSQFAVGDKVYLKENTMNPQFVSTPTPPDPAPGLPIGTVLMRFDVIGNATIPDTPPIPSILTDLPPIPAAGSSAPFEWGFRFIPGRPGGAFRISHSAVPENDANHVATDLPFDQFNPAHVVLKGSTEEWVIRNDTMAGSWLHPVHIHLEEGRILERTVCNVPSATGCAPANRTVVPLTPWEDAGNSRRDVYPVPGQHRLRIRLAFRDFVGRYLIHCHNMNHEDAFMMLRWDVVDSMAELRKRREEINAERIARGDTPLYTKEDLG
jgi:FtsP/CotA-like multicopper oxidase with cupredoxin domain